eukprot:CAMPEP_0171885824 /NCGR_PEP_ID=MMETSP0992-20121227/41550_1 /TAXON_ID=483369 /ORGANISM="non described non described, Strain CCMP2098" /LENGTH=235 /DNA_ID=CAMNT_0012512395 /DNA_START=204 /DNA_END=907 /DNA_ORIENTATION=+
MFFGVLLEPLKIHFGVLLEPLKIIFPCRLQFTPHKANFAQMPSPFCAQTSHAMRLSLSMHPSAKLRTILCYEGYMHHAITMFFDIFLEPLKIFFPCILSRVPRKANFIQVPSPLFTQTPLAVRLTLHTHPEAKLVTIFCFKGFGHQTITMILDVLLEQLKSLFPCRFSRVPRKSNFIQVPSPLFAQTSLAVRFNHQACCLPLLRRIGAPNNRHVHRCTARAAEKSLAMQIQTGST